MFLLDTNIISEMMRAAPNKGLLSWFQDVQSESLFLSVVTLGEIQKGIDLKKAKEPEYKAERHLGWLSDLSKLYKDRILPVDTNVAKTWGQIMAIDDKHAIDGLIAATAVVHTLTIVTRNTRDFQAWPVTLLNPFSN